MNDLHFAAARCTAPQEAPGGGMMGIHVIKMPDIGEGIAEVELVAWHVKPGDAVVEDQVLADVMTDKATVEIPSPVAGKVIALGGETGQVMAVGSELIRIEVEGAGNVKDGAGRDRRQQRQPAASAAPAAPRRSRKPSARHRTAGARARRRTPRPRRRAKPRPPSRRQRANPATSPSPRPPCAAARGSWASNCSSCRAADRPAASRTRTSTLTAARAPGQRSPANGGARYAERNDEEAIPVIGLRRKIAQKMQEAKRRIPHFTYVEEVDVTELEALRAQLNANRAPSAAASRCCRS